jgi:hydroxyethylthiazole kinase
VTAAEVAAGALHRIAAQRPLVHHITNVVTVNDVANLTLAYGALPVMTSAPEEVVEMVSAASALVLNIGTLTGSSLRAMLLAGAEAGSRGIPIVLDPVGAGATALRTDAARRLLAELPVTVLRGNRGEIGALVGAGSVRGVEAVGDEDPVRVASEARDRFGTVVAVTGPIDTVAGPGAVRSVANGDPRLASITGSGCMATAAIGAMLTAGGDSAELTALALATYGLAAERASAGGEVRGPGTFRARLLDEAAALAGGGLAGLRVEVCDA